MKDAPQNLPCFQFSLRSLFWLTAVVAVVVGTISMLVRTHYFRALGNVHAYLALLPIAGVWGAWRSKILTDRQVVPISLLLYTASFVLPILRIEGSIWFGYDALLWSLISVFSVADYHMQVLSRTSAGWIAYCLITLANVTYFYAFFRFNQTPATRDVRIACRFTSIASSLLALPLLCASNAIDNIYIGYGVWVAAMLAMWLGVREENRKPNERHR